MIRKLFERFTRKSGLARPQQWLKDALGVESTAAGIDVTAEGALASSVVCACVRLLSESVASLPLHVYRRDEHGKAKAPEHTLYSLIHDRPNAFMTSYSWRCKMMVDILLHGNSFNVIERDLQGRIVALWPMDPRAVTIKAKDGTLFYEVWTGAERRHYQHGEVLHCKGFSLDGIVGMGVIRMAREGIGLDLAMQQHGASLFKNQARPGLVINHAEWLSSEARQQLASSFNESLQGALKAGKTVVMEGGMTLQTLGFSNDDAQFLQSGQFSVQELARFFKINPHLVGDPTRLAYASSEAEFNAYLVHSLGPWLRNLESEMNATLLPDRTTFLIEFDPNGMARGSQAERYAAYEKGLGGPSPWLTVADVRAAENLPFIDGTDQLPTREVQNVAA